MAAIQVCLAVVLLGALASIHASEVEVRIQNGPIVGDKIVEQGRDLHRFLGIPYAQPPVGKLRFRRPVPVEPWNQSINALQWPNNCVQFLSGIEAESPERYHNQNFSEDCLYLNIWSPNSEVDEANLRPVLVWIHGGGLILGGSSFFLYDGRTLAAMSDAVVVSLNYRLSTLGFLYSDEVPDVKGNQGFWDQALALEWVNENIRYFGGDPSKITIMGESAGSWSVTAHIISPASRHLFHNAIAMSAAITYGALETAETMVTKLLKGIRAVGCATESDSTISQKVIDCLQQLDSEKVDSIYYHIEPPFHTIAVVDGEFFPAHPKTLLANGDHKKNFSLLASTVEDEASFLLYLGGNDTRFRQHYPDPLTLEEAQEFLINLIKQHVKNEQVPRETINKIYFNGINGNYDHANVYRKQVGIAYGDLFLNCPVIKFARSVFSNSADSVRVYQWYYTAKMGNLKMLCSEWSGTCHVDDLYPAFGVPFQSPQQYLSRERDISREVIGFIKSFIYNGTPGEEHREWQSYFVGVDGKSVVAPYYELGNQPKSHHNFKFDLKHTECDVWNQFYE